MPATTALGVIRVMFYVCFLHDAPAARSLRKIWSCFEGLGNLSRHVCVCEMELCKIRCKRLNGEGLKNKVATKSALRTDGFWVYECVLALPLKLQDQPWPENLDQMINEAACGLCTVFAATPFACDACYRYYFGCCCHGAADAGDC